MKSELKLPRNIFTEQETFTTMLNFAKITKIIALGKFIQEFFFFMVRFSRLSINCDNHVNEQITANKCLDLIPPWFDGKQTRD